MGTGVRILVSGLVQGVGFRYFVYNSASRYKLTGFVRNMYDGSVEIEAEGDRSLIEEFIDDVKVGPRAARVADVKVIWKEPRSQYSHFDIL